MTSRNTAMQRVAVVIVQLLVVYVLDTPQQLYTTTTTDAFPISFTTRQTPHSPCRIVPPHSTCSLHPSTTLLYATTKKGFGKPTNSPSSSSSSSKSESASSPASSNQIEATTTTTTTKEAPTSTSMNAGQRALQEMRRQKIEERDQELRQVREMIQADEQVQNAGPVAIPERVAQRMGLRMLPFVGIPFFGGMMTFVAFWYYATYENIQFEPTLVAASTIALLVIGLLGITYSVMSASWDPDREGSFLGWDEFQLNLQNVQDGLRRSRSNAILREKMSNLSTKEVQEALQDLDRREMKK